MKPETINEYIAIQPEEVQSVLQEIRSVIKQVVPEGEETINYDIPAICLVKGGKRDKQIMFAAFKNHIGFYPHPATIEHFKNELDGFKHAKGSIQFPLNKPIPFELITRMVQYRLNELLTKDENHA